MWQTVFLIETHFPIETLYEGCTHDIMKHRHLHTIAFEYCAFKKTPFLSGPLYPNHSCVLALPIIIRTSSYTRVRNMGGPEKQTTSGYACNDLAFDTRNTELISLYIAFYDNTNFMNFPYHKQ